MRVLFPLCSAFLLLFQSPPAPPVASTNAQDVVSISGGGAAVNGDEAVFGVIGVAVEGVVNQRAEESVRSPIRSTPRPTFKHRRWGTRLPHALLRQRLSKNLRRATG